MCGIVAVVRRRSGRVPPTSAEVLDLLSPVVVALRGWGDGQNLALQTRTAAERLAMADRLLQGTAGLQAMLGEKTLRATIGSALGEINALINDLEADLDRSGGDRASEEVNAALIQMKDAAWAIGNDRLNTAAAVADLAGPGAGEAALEAYSSVQIALSALDRLEVRGRDSAGLHILVSGHGLDPEAPAVAAAVTERAADPLFQSGSVRWADGCLSFVYKAAAEIGDLGDNTAALRDAIAADDLLAAAVDSDEASAVVVGHTRWASVGMINEANAHPLNSELAEGSSQPYAIGVLNGDVDNHTDLVAQQGLILDPGITTDAKVIPALWSARLNDSSSPDAAVDAFRRTVADLNGSVAIAGQTAANPNQLLLALRGSGQALYIGTAEDAYVVASEPYGLVEQSSRYLRMDGETPSDPNNADTSRGQVVVLNRDHAGDLTAVERYSYDGTPLPVGDTDVVDAEITTRDVDRRGFPHFLLKEITESPESFRKTLRGRIVSTEGEQGSSSLAVKLGSETLPDSLVQRLANGQIANFIVIGPGHCRGGLPQLGPLLAPRDARPPRQLGSGHRVVGVRLADRYERHPGHRHQPIGHHHRHQSHRRSRSAPGSGGHRRRQPAQQRPL